jgi:PAS domain S-box-containing protein
MFQDKIRLKRLKEVGVFKKRLSTSKLASQLRSTEIDKKQELNACIHTYFDPQVTISPEGKITDVNEAFEKVTGVTQEALIGTDFSNYFTEPEKARVGYKKVFEEGLVSYYPLTIRHKKGKLTDVLYNTSAYKDDRGNVLGVLTVDRDFTSQKQASQYARSLIEVSLDPLVTISPEGKITDVNEASEKVTGVSRDGLIGTDFFSYFTEPEKAIVGSKKVFEEGLVTNYPLTIRHKNGKLTDVQYNASVYKDDKGNVVGVLAAARDVTELNIQNNEREKRAIEIANLKVELEQQIGCLNEAAIVSEADADGNIIFVNDKFCEISGYKREELLGVSQKTLRGSKHPDSLSISLWETIQSGKLWKGKLVRKKRGGEEFYWADTTIMPFKDLNGKIVKYVCIQFDITDQVERKEALTKHAEELRISEEDLQNINAELEVRSAKDLIESENRFRSLFENAPQCMLVFDLKSKKIIKANKSALALFKYSIEDLLKMGRKELSPKWQPDGGASIKKITADIGMVRKGEKVSQEWLFNDAAGNDILAELSIMLPSDANPSQVYVSIVDVTEKNIIKDKLKRQLEELKKSNDELDHFVYSVSHDLRSPLKSLLGLSNMIVDDISPDNSLQLEQMGMMQSSILKLDNFIEDILDYSRNAREEVKKKAIDFKQTIGEVRDNLAHMDGADKIELKVEIDQKMEFISDMARVNMVFSNLISNAIKYRDDSKENAYIAINVKCSDEFTAISIEDNGIGIDAKYEDRIFDMFYRGTKKSSGSGLGLYIAKEAIEKLNGTIEMESELTKGTKFTITIPNQIGSLN